VIGLGLGAVACGDGSGGDGDAAPLETAAASTTADPGLPPCRDVNRAVVFTVFGTATTGVAGEASRWMNDPAAEPDARPGVAAVAGAYREIGYEILYVALLPSDARIDGRPVVDAVTVWLGLNGFPVGEGVRVWAPEGDGAGDPSVALIEELAIMGAAGTEVDVGYASDQETAFPMVAGGLPGEQVFVVGDADGGASSDGEVPSNPLPDEDLSAHVAQVQARDPICE
jgi:hypothetical protein